MFTVERQLTSCNVGGGQVRREPKEVQKERQEAAAAARAVQRAAQRQRADSKTKMKGKNRPSRRQVPLLAHL